MTKRSPSNRRASSSGSQSNIQTGNIVLFGEILADMFPDRAVLGGAPFNVARHLKAFGQNPVLISSLGNDTLSAEVMAAMTSSGMETLGVQCSHRHPTGRVKVLMEGSGHRFEILPFQAYDYINSSEARSVMLSVNPELVYFGTLAQRSEISRQALETLLCATGAPKFLDINLRAPWYDENILRQSLQSADIVKLNGDELLELVEIFRLSGSGLQAQAAELISRFNLERILVTCGEGGAWHVDRNGNKVEAAVKSSLKKMVDTVGAGDGFAAVSILGLLMRWPVENILQRANKFAAAICEIRGAVPEEADFYKPFIKEWRV